MRIVLYTIIFILLGIIVYEKFPPFPDYDVGACVKDSIFNQTRRIKEIHRYYYIYCRYNEENKCVREFIMRINQFDEIMEEGVCPSPVEEKEDEKNSSPGRRKRLRQDYSEKYYC